MKSKFPLTGRVDIPTGTVQINTFANMDNPQQSPMGNTIYLDQSEKIGTTKDGKPIIASIKLFTPKGA